MADRITELVEHAVGSPWVYLALFAFAAIDAFFPIVPSESLVISAGVFAASGSEPELVPIILSAAAARSSATTSPTSSGGPPARS